MNIKLIFSDVDGTLLDINREISAETKVAVQGLSHLPFILISSRMPSAMHHLQDDLDIKHHPIIAYNGGLILDGQRVLSSTYIDWSLTEAIVKLNQNKTHLSIYQDHNWYVPSLDFWAKREVNNTKVTPKQQDYTDTLESLKQEKAGAHKIMSMGEEQSIDYLYHLLHDHFGDVLHLYRSKPTYIEIAPKAISKLSAITTLLEHRFKTVKLEHCLAFGDNYNDIEMLKGVGLGVAVANAKPEVLKIAHQVTGTSKNHGVAQFLNTNIT